MPGRRLLVLFSIPLALFAAVAPARADLVTVSLFNTAVFEQTSSAPPVSPSGFFFNIGGQFQNVGDFDSASATFPGGSQNLPIFGTAFGASSPLFPTLSDLHAAFPFGTYTITATNSATSTSESGVIEYTQDVFASEIPALTPATYDGLQGLNPLSNFVIEFNPWTVNPLLTEGLTFFSIFDATTFNTVFTGGFLSPATNSLLLPAGTLAPETTYRFSLDFSGRLHGFDDINDVFTLQGFDVVTNGTFTTGPAVVPEPGSLALLASGLPVLLGLRKRRARRLPAVASIVR